MDYSKLTDEKLINLLFTEEDRLPRIAVNEFLARGNRMVKPLADIVNNNFAWMRDIPEWWAVIHGVFILGAIGTGETAVPLLKSLQFAAAHDCDWVTEQIPSIFGSIGTDAMEGLKIIASDWTRDWFTRVIAIEGLAAITIKYPETEKDIFAFIGSIFSNKTEDNDVRAHAGSILLDFQKEEFRDKLLDFGENERKIKNNDMFYNLVFDEDDVKTALDSHKKDLRHYRNDWLSFYDENEIKKRQKRWEREEMGLLDNEREEMFACDSRKVGRNEPCPCGSGKKYKKCCLK